MAMILWIQVREESSQIVFPVFVHDKFFLHFLTNLSRVLAQAQDQEHEIHSESANESSSSSNGFAGAFALA
jgi:hypothetical protein